jgi:hypothetical protein
VAAALFALTFPLVAPFWLNPWLLAPVLVLTLLFGPLGLAAYLTLRQVAGRVAA